MEPGSSDYRTKPGLVTAPETSASSCLLPSQRGADGVLRLQQMVRVVGVVNRNLKSLRPLTAGFISLAVFRNLSVCGELGAVGATQRADETGAVEENHATEYDVATDLDWARANHVRQTSSLSR